MFFAESRTEGYKRKQLDVKKTVQIHLNKETKISDSTKYKKSWTTQESLRCACVCARAHEHIHVCR
jgi:hypothetical protein